MTGDNQEGRISVLTDVVAEEKEQQEDVALRPQFLNEFLGQRAVKRNLAIFIQAAKERKQALEHVLFYGPPGLGKTSLAHVIARELGANIRITSGPALERPGDLASILSNLQDADVLFIDEIHRLKRPVEEMLYPGMEDFALDIILGKGPSAKTMRLALPKFTLIGATTQVGRLSSPLRDRFGTHLHLDFYEHEEIAAILSRNAKSMGLQLATDGATTIARRARRTPRIANRLLRRVRDYAQVHRFDTITSAVAEKALDMLAIDECGLTALDRSLLAAIITSYQGGPVGLSTLAAVIGEDEATIEEVHEPFLLREGLLERTPRGRKVTPKGQTLFGGAGSTL